MGKKTHARVFKTEASAPVVGRNALLQAKQGPWHTRSDTSDNAKSRQRPFDVGIAAASSNAHVGHNFAQIAILPAVQAKLTVGEPNDKYEQEADRVADAVMRMPEPQAQGTPEDKNESDQSQASNSSNIGTNNGGGWYKIWKNGKVYVQYFDDGNQPKGSKKLSKEEVLDHYLIDPAAFSSKGASGTLFVDAISGAAIKKEPSKEGRNWFYSGFLTDDQVTNFADFARMHGNSKQSTEGMVKEIVRRGGKELNKAKVNELQKRIKQLEQKNDSLQQIINNKK